MMRAWFDFNGRGDRIDFLGTVWLLLPGLALLGTPLFLMGMGVLQQAALLAFDLVALGLGLAAILVAMAGAARRLQDLGFSAWWLALAVLVPVVGLVGLVVLALVPGSAEPNAYGPSPRRTTRGPLAT
ncbi:hypothetical protein CFHF_02855 [Caulobacter flavus]|uniref:DUF805 domain-containing protein n=1 Tax=Caulobacter flavus TaxID=1679497 RepID=A0A2N5CYS3_9CAUL|nr:DUF805 domain-containing protein [Caulobacter flavus]AYV45351.1 hypothetical protein C1707_03320 [Caulobacter flavus]PLR18968.1 hypothetical protein CFHF_02855 [Caulobacter flavus]